MKKDSSIYVEAFSYTHSASGNIQFLHNIQLPSSISTKLANQERNEVKSRKVPRIKMKGFSN